MRRLRRLTLAGLGALSPAAALAQAPAPAPPAAPAPAATVQGVTVQAAPEAAVRTSIDRRSYSVAGDLQGANGSIADALRNVPGAEVDLQGNVTVRGGRVRFLLDGQPTALFSGPNGSLILQSMSADRIDRVEVITNPTAEFSPEGQGGIINLVTKKTAPAGTSGAIRANAGTEGRINGAGNIVYTKGKLTLNADAGVRRDEQKVSPDTTGTVTDPVTGQTDSRTQDIVSNGPMDSWNSHVGFDYRPDPKTQITGDARYNSFSQSRYNDSDFLSSDPTGAPLAAYTRASADDVTTGSHVASGQLQLRHLFPGQDHTLVLFFNHSQSQFRSENPSIDETTVPPPVSSEFEDQLSRINTDVNEFKADYTRPMPDKGQFKTGYDVRITNDVFNNFGIDGPGPATAALNPLYTNLFRYSQMVNDAYVTYQQPIGKFTVLGGLRVDNEKVTLDQITQSQNVGYDRTNLFPTLHLAYEASPNAQWVASYSSRIQRPTPNDLNPFRNLTDPYNLSEGNPNLLPQITQSFEGGWQYRKGATSYIATLFYRDSDKGVTSVVEDLGGGVLLSTRENLSSSRTAGLELIGAGPLTKTLTYNASTDIYWNQIEAPALGVFQTRQDVTASGHVSLNWNPTKVDLVQFNGTVNAARLTPQGYNDPLFITFFGYRHKFTDHFAVVGQLQDPFGIVHPVSYLNSSGFDERTNTRVGFRAVFVGFTYSFGGNARAPRDPGFDFNAAPPSTPGG